MATATTTTALQALDALDRTAIAVGRQSEEIAGELAQVGHRARPQNARTQTPGAPASGEIGRLVAQIAAAHGIAAREGKRGDVAKFEARIVELEAKRERLRLARSGVQREAERVKSERVQLLRERHDELVQAARDFAEQGEQLWETLAAAAQDVANYRPRVQELVQLVIAGHPGSGPGATQEDEQARRQLVASFAPWRGATPDLNERWLAVAKVSVPPLGEVE